MIIHFIFVNTEHVELLDSIKNVDPCLKAWKAIANVNNIELN